MTDATALPERLDQLRRAIEEKVQGTKRNLMVASRAMRSHGDDAYAAQLALIGAELTELDGHVTDVLQLLSQLSAADARAEEQERSPILDFQAWAERRTIELGPMTQDEYFLAQAAFFAAHPGKGPTSHFQSDARAEDAHREQERKLPKCPACGEWRLCAAGCDD